MKPTHIVLAVTLSSLVLLAGIGDAQALPSGFSRKVVAAELDQPTAMAFAPDGRLFITEKTGKVRIIKNGVLRQTAFVSISVDEYSERGLLGIAFDPQFAANHYVYVYYTTGQNALHYSGSAKNRVSRFTAHGDTAVTSSEKILLDTIPSDAGNHNGGAIHFGPDGKLYIAVGDGGQYHEDAQKLNNLRGKILRITKTGQIPADNPYAGQANKRGEIWASGLRNPYRFTFQPSNGALIIADVGQDSWEEIDIGVKAGNYGWPNYEGPCAYPDDVGCVPNRSTYPPRYRYPAYVYDHGVGDTVIGGAFANGGNYPALYRTGYFFGDYAFGWVSVLAFDSANKITRAKHFDTLSGPVDFAFGPDQRIYAISINNGAVYRYDYTPPAPQP
jgi:glucose/arabinose dehydrogenase